MSVLPGDGADPDDRFEGALLIAGAIIDLNIIRTTFIDGGD